MRRRQYVRRMRPRQLGALIARIRKQKNPEMSQQALAAAAQLTQGQLSRIESGHVKNPHSLTLERIAAALEVSIDLLMGRAVK